MQFPWKIIRRSTADEQKLPADQKLETIQNILFPPLKTNTLVSPAGEKIKFLTDYSIDANIEAVINDVEDGATDEIAAATLRKIIIKLHKIRAILNAHNIIDLEAKYIVVDIDEPRDNEINVD